MCNLFKNFYKMIGILITHYDWPLDAHLLARRVTIYAHYSERPSLNMFKAIKKTLVESSPLPKKLIVYSKTCIRVLDFHSKTGNYLDADDDINKHEVIFVHVKFSKFEKGRYTQFFFNTEHTYDNKINVLCSTSGVGNVGLDSPHIKNLFRI